MSKKVPHPNTRFVISKVHPRLFKVVRNEGRTAESTYLYLKVPKIECVIVHVQCMIVFYSSEWHLPSKLKIMVMLKNPQQKNKIVIVIIFRLNIIVIIYLFFYLGWLQWSGRTAEKYCNGNLIYSHLFVLTGDLSVTLTEIWESLVPLFSQNQVKYN